MRVTRIDAGNGVVGPMGMPGHLRTYEPVWSGQGLTYTGTPATGKYAKIGDLVFFTVEVSCATVTNFGSTNNGHYHLTLPYPPVGDYVFRNGGIHHETQGYHFSIAADAEDGEISMGLYYTGSNGQDISFDANSPHALEVGDYFYVSGLYIRG
ncbi:MAG: hypothetical protein EBT80_00815 [Chitinophagales bacterium]|nr:hypothetical protein [Chitinophagales bacterium]